MNRKAQTTTHDGVKMKWTKKEKFFTASGKKYNYAFNQCVLIIQNKGIETSISACLSVKSLKIAKELVAILEK